MATKKRAKKATAKKTTAPTTTKSMKVSEKRSETASKRSRFINKRNLVILVGIVILGVLIYMFRGLFIAATVNGQPITRIELVQELEKQNGEKTLESLITKRLILKEMEKKGISVTDAEVQTEIKKIEDALSKQGRTLSDALAQQGLTRSDLTEQLKIQKMIEKLFSKDAVVSDAEVDKYVEDNKDALPTDQDEKTLKATIKEQLKQQKLTTKFQEWLQGLQKNAKIDYYVTF